VRKALAQIGGWLCLGLLLLPGCEDNPARPDAEPAPAARVSHFDRTKAGTIRGQVLWQGDLPAVPPFAVYCNPAFGPPLDENSRRDNPNAPQIDSTSRGVADAVVFLRAVAPAKARPWDHGPVRVEQRGGSLHILQDGTDSRAGFVQRGDRVTLVSQDPFLHALHASGAAFFTLTFPWPGQPLLRRFGQSGQVELSSGMGYFWMRGYLFVDEHPYYTRTDAQGRFTLNDVPVGRYRLACWHPSWLVQDWERDPETALISRLTFRPPVVREQDIEVRPGTATTAQFVLSTNLFMRP
jgi:hypothetical protein